MKKLVYEVFTRGLTEDSKEILRPEAEIYSDGSFKVTTETWTAEERRNWSQEKNERYTKENAEFREMLKEMWSGTLSLVRRPYMGCWNDDYPEACQVLYWLFLEKYFQEHEDPDEYKNDYEIRYYGEGAPWYSMQGASSYR